MKSPEFVGYVGISALPDAIALRVSVEVKAAEVVAEGSGGRQHVIRFEGVEVVEMKQPEGMLLYSLSEMRTVSPFRKFVFTNNDEDHPSSLDSRN